MRRFWLFLACAAVLLGVGGGIAIGIRFATAPPAEAVPAPGAPRPGR